MRAKGSGHCASILCAPLGLQFVIHAFVGVTLNPFGHWEFSELTASSGSAAYSERVPVKLYSAPIISF